MTGAPPPAAAGAKAPWWPVSTVKFTVMTLGTFGLYHYYWIYENWKLMRAAGARVGSPFWRTFFAPFTVYRLFDRLRDDAQLNGIPAPWSAVGLAAAYFVASIALVVGVPAWLTSAVLLLPVLPAQITLERLNAKVAPDAPRNDRFTVTNLVMLALGLSLTFFAWQSERLVDQLLQEWTP